MSEEQRSRAPLEGIVPTETKETGSYSAKTFHELSCTEGCFYQRVKNLLEEALVYEERLAETRGLVEG